MELSSEERWGKKGEAGQILAGNLPASCLDFARNWRDPTGMLHMVL
ncbi:hypothetical protein ACFOLJ_19460 [Rugamonas sp. CCM 8940]|nr:hypothetical protein [Rugamonas sp. CCM 8940]MBJ7314270.1 hypothetical protein [Rugamonas sp. CCM 8940]